jgi:cytochrome c
MGDKLLFGCLLFNAILFAGCENKPAKEPPRKKIDYIKAIPGPSDKIDPEVAKKGEVLVSYSDCYTCHKVDERSAGPSFRDIAKRYPVKKIYIDMLAQKVIAGGNGAWGYPVMDPHPKLSMEDAKLMVTYVLSMRK